MDLSYSSTALARQCPKKYYWKQIERIEPRDKSQALALGSAIHDALELFYKGKTRTECLKFINDSYDKSLNTCGPEEEERIYLSKCTALAMFHNAPLDLITFEHIDPEVSFIIPLNGDINFKGRVDGVLTVKNRKWIREVKTTSLSIPQFEMRTKHSYQGTGYVWGVQKHLDEEIAGIYYDLFRKPQLRKRESEDMKAFGQRIMDFYIEPRNHKYLYKRIYSYRTPDDIRRFEKDIVGLAKELRERYANDNWYRNTDACCSWNRMCEYEKICFSDEPDQLVLDLFFTRANATAQNHN